MRRHLFRAFVAVAFLGLSAVGYSYSSFASWATVPVTFFVNAANLDVTPAAALAAMRAGMDQWTNAGSGFSFQYGGPASDTNVTLDNRNVAFFRNASSGNAIATTYSWWDNNGDLLDSDIVFWDASFTFFSGTSGCGGTNGAYIEDIATHEFGHALGLGHSDIAGATMFPSYPLCSQQFRTLAQDDLNGVRALYPAVGNTPPTVTITSPANGASFELGTVITFTATASDTQDGNLTAQIQWTDNGTSIGSGGSLSLALTTLGPHVIVARVTDSGSLQATAQVTITINPASGSTGTLSASAGVAGGGYHRVILTWSGVAGVYVEVYRNGVRAFATSNSGSQHDYPGTQVPASATYTYKVCSYGTNTCTNTVTVSYGTGNTAPVVTITSPANGASFVQGTTISLTATASDTQDGNLTGQIQWTDNGTPIGSGGTVSRTLTTLGAHVIVATVTDTGGLPGSSQVSITVTAPANTPPTVTITSPANGASFVQGTVISFTATASDTQDGNLTAQIQWTDNGTPIGSGGSLSLALTALGSHVIVARVTDSGSLQTTAQVTITINPAGGSTGTLSASAGVAGGGHHRVTLTWTGVAGVYVEVYRNGLRAFATSNSGAQHDYPGTLVPATATYTYKVCSYGTNTCTNTVSVSY